MFKIAFQYLKQPYTATVQKIQFEPIEFIVFDLAPHIVLIPDRLIFESNPANDQLIYKSFNPASMEVLTIIGQSIFTTCYEQKIAVHS